jgi:hypothetical protein
MPDMSRRKMGSAPPSRARVLTFVAALAILLAWGGIHFWTKRHDDRPLAVTGTVHAEWIPDAEWHTIDPHQGVSWDSPLKAPDGRPATRAVLLRVTLHANRYPGGDQNSSICWQVVFAHPELPHWSMVSAGPIRTTGALPTVSIQGSSEEQAFLGSHPGLVSPEETGGERMNDFGVQLTDPNVSYLTAIAVVPAAATGDPGSVRAWVSSTCVHDVTFTELSHA